MAIKKKTRCTRTIQHCLPSVGSFLTSYVLSHACFNKTSLHLCPLQRNIPSHVCLNKTSSHPCLIQRNIPTCVCPNRTPSDTTDFPKLRKNKPLSFHFRKLLQRQGTEAQVDDLTQDLAINRVGLSVHSSPGHIESRKWTRDKVPVPVLWTCIGKDLLIVGGLLPHTDPFSFAQPSLASYPQAAW